MDRNVFDQDEPNTGAQTFEEASNLLGLCQRFESRDHAFGDREIYWRRGEHEVADGYFGGGSAEVFIAADFGGGVFKGDQARALAKRGSTVVIGRNDETGPDEYKGE